MDVRSNSIQQIVYIFHFIKDTGIIPQALLGGAAHTKTPKAMHKLSKQISGKNRNIVMLILMTNLIYKIGMSLYKL
jgi:hypothetical protein